MPLLIAVSSVSHSLLPQIRALPLPHVAPLLGALALWEPRGPPCLAQPTLHTPRGHCPSHTPAMAPRCFHLPFLDISHP